MSIDLTKDAYRLGEIITTVNDLRRIEHFDPELAKKTGERAIHLIEFQADYIRALKLQIVGKVDPDGSMIAEVERLRAENKDLKKAAADAGWAAEFRRTMRV